MPDPDSAIPPRPPKVGRNKRRISRRKRKRDGVWIVKEKAQRHPATREPLAFPERLVEKYGTVKVKDTVKMNWFSVTGLLHAVGAFIGLRVLDMARVAGWTADQLMESQGFVLVKWDGRYVVFGAYNVQLWMPTDFRLVRVLHWSTAWATSSPDVLASHPIQTGRATAPEHVLRWTRLLRTWVHLSGIPMVVAGGSGRYLLDSPWVEGKRCVFPPLTRRFTCKPSSVVSHADGYEVEEEREGGRVALCGSQHPEACPSRKQ